MDSPLEHDVTVVGAGLAGLAAAQMCRRAGLDVVVLDAHPGGRARSDVDDGFIFNRGAHALYRGGASEQVLQSLGVVYRGGPPGIVGGAILAAGKQFPMPATPATMIKSRYLGLRDKVSLGKMFAKLPKLNAADFASVPVTEFLSDMTEKARGIAAMAIRTSTYSCDFDQLSAEVAIVAMQAPGVLYIDGGWQVLVDALSAGLDVHPATATAIGDGEVTTDRGVYRSRMVVVAAGTPAAAARLLGSEPFDVAGPIEAACLDLGLRAAPTKPTLMAIEEPIYFSCHSPAARLAPAGRFVAHAARYVMQGEVSSPQTQRRELEAHASLVGMTDTSIVTSRYLHRMTVVGALPTASRGGLRGRPGTEVPGRSDVLIAGDWVGPHGQLADAAFASAKAAADRICAKLGS